VLSHADAVTRLLANILGFAEPLAKPDNLAIALSNVDPHIATAGQSATAG
jgi:hypothetical protein